MTLLEIASKKCLLCADCGFVLILPPHVPMMTALCVCGQGMKQMTLLEIASKKGSKSPGPSSTPKKSPAKPQTPLIVKK